MSDEEKAPELPMPTQTPSEVPYRRFAESVEAHRAAEAQITELRSQIEQMGPIREQLNELTAALQAERHERQTVEVLAQNGIGDKDLRDLVRWSYERLPAEGRPAFDEAVASWKANPDAAPVALRPHLQTAPPPMPTSDLGALRQPAANGQLDPAGMDLEQWRAHRETIRGLKPR